MQMICSFVRSLFTSQMTGSDASQDKDSLEIIDPRMILDLVDVFVEVQFRLTEPVPLMWRREDLIELGFYYRRKLLTKVVYDSTQADMFTTPKLYLGRLSNSYMLRAYLFNNKIAMNNSLGLFLRKPSYEQIHTYGSVEIKFTYTGIKVRNEEEPSPALLVDKLVTFREANRS